MSNDLLEILKGDILEENVCYSFRQICHLVQLPAETVCEMIELGILEPVNTPQEPRQFSGSGINRLRCAQRLKRDLGVNNAGAALAVDLLEEIQTLRARIRLLENMQNF